MATRFYFTSSTTAPPNSPGFAAWTRTTEGVRRNMSTTKDATAMASLSSGGNTAMAVNASFLFAQFHSEPLAVGTAFVTTDTIKCVIRCFESAANDNINRTPLCLKVYNGTTLQATLKALGAYGPNTTEWSTSLRNKQLADGDTLDANYTTVAGDYLVLEVGGQVSSAGGTSVTGSMSFGSDSGTDLAENETGTAADNPWFEISRNFGFARDATASLSGSGALAATGGFDMNGAAALAASATLAAIGGFTLNGIAVLSASASLAANGLMVYDGNAVLPVTGALAAGATATYAGAAAFAGSAAISPAGVVTYMGATALAATGALSPLATLDKLAAAALNASAALTVAGTVLAGDMTLTVELYQGATLIASWAETPLDALTEYSHDLSAGERAAITDWGDLRLRFTANNSAGRAEVTQAFLEAPEGLGVLDGVTSLSGSGALAAAGVLTFSGVVSLAATGSLAPTAQLTANATAALNASATMAANGLMTFRGESSLAASGALDAIAQATYGAASALSGTGSVTPVATRDLGALAVLSAAATTGVLATVFAQHLASISLAGAAILNASATLILRSFGPAATVAIPVYDALHALPRYDATLSLPAYDASISLPAYDSTVRLAGRPATNLRRR